MSVRKVVKDNLRKAVLWVLEPDPSRSLEPHRPRPQTKSMGIPDLKGRKQTRLVLASLLLIHDSICDADAWQGYEGTPDQVEKIMWEVYGILTMHPEVEDPQEVHDFWLDEYAVAELQKEMGWVPRTTNQSIVHQSNVSQQSNDRMKTLRIEERIIRSLRSLYRGVHKGCLCYSSQRRPFTAQRWDD